MKNHRNTLITLAIALLLGGYVYFFERGPVKPKEDETKKVKIFDNFVADDIREINIEYFGSTSNAQKYSIDIQKDDKDVWQITSPQNFKADEGTVRSMLTGVGDFNPDTTIDNPTSLKDFGLDPPVARCVMKAKTGAAFDLLIGDKNMGNSSTYVKPANKKSVYLVATYAADNLKKGLNDYRDHNFFKTDIVLAQKVQVTRAGKTILFEKDKDNSWSITQPLQAKADSSKIRDLLNSISSLRIEEFANDHPSNLGGYGLSSPKAKVEVWSTDSKTPRFILFGKKKDKTTNMYAKDSDHPFVYLVGEFFDKTIDLKLSDYRDKTAMQFDGGSAVTLTVKHGDKSYTYQKDAKNQWTASGRTDANGEASNMINQLSGISISDYAAPGPATGLKRPAFIVEAALADKTTRVFRFGNRDKGKVYLASDKTKDIYLVPDSVIAQMEGYFNTILTPVSFVYTPTKK